MNATDDMAARRARTDTNAARIAEAFRAACRIELEALKPGNVHRHAAGHGMTIDDFIASADAAAPAIAAHGERVGARVLSAVEATWSRVGCNTNLGIVLLCAPLAVAAERAALSGPLSPAALETETRCVLDQLDRDDAVLAFRAIARANPGGLGAAAQHDVHADPQVDLRTAMAAAADRDRIAYQYVNAYADVFGFALPSLRALLARGIPIDTSAAALYVAILVRWPDTHVLRKFGDKLAHSVSDQARELQARFPDGPLDDEAHQAWLAWDTALKSQGINPGTSADLTVATLFAHRLCAA